MHSENASEHSTASSICNSIIKHALEDSEAVFFGGFQPEVFLLQILLLLWKFRK
jgi:hypothetical protein